MKNQHVLQARASKAYKVGALILTPGCLVPLQDTKVLRNQLAKASVQTGSLHLNMLKYVDMKIAIADPPLVKPKKGDPPPQVLEKPKDVTFLVPSPALSFGRPKDFATSLSNLPPFWAVLGCSGVAQHHNMELTHVSLTESGYEATCAPPLKLPRGLILEADVPILRNVVAIEEDEVLCLPFGAELHEYGNE